MNSSKESGVAIWYILAGVALFGALSYSFVRSVNDSQSNVSKEQSKIIANEILSYAKSVEQGVQRLMTVNRCSENEISFYSDKWDTPADYDNVNTPFASGDFNCHVFHPEGAGVTWQDLLEILQCYIILRIGFKVLHIERMGQGTQRES